MPHERRLNTGSSAKDLASALRVQSQRLWVLYEEMKKLTDEAKEVWDEYARIAAVLERAIFLKEQRRESTDDK